MTETLKPGWRRVKFGDVVRLSKARSQNPLADGLERYVGLEHLEPGDLRIRSWGNVADGTTFTNRFEPGQVLFGKRRAYQRKVAVADFAGVCSGDIYVLESKDADVLLPELLPFICQTNAFFEHAVGTSAGSLSPRTNWTSLAGFEFLLPTIEEQLRRVERLRSVDSVRSTQAGALVELHRLRKATIDHLLALSDDQVRRGRLDDFVTMQNGRPFPGDEYSDRGVKLMRPGNLSASGYLSWPHDKTVFLNPSWENEAHEFVIEPGDVVINLTAQSLEDGFMGRVCLAREGDKSLLNQRIGRFRYRGEAVLPEYLYRSLQTSRFRHHAHANCEGSKVKHLFWQHLAKYEISVPDLATQQEVIAQCAAIDEAIDEMSARLAMSSLLAARVTNELAAEG